MRSVIRNIIRTLGVLVFWVAALPAQMLILSPAENSVTDLHHIAVTVMGKPSAEATLYLNDEPVSSGKIRADGVYDFINVEVPDGPVSLRVESLGARKRLYTAERSIHILGAPKEILPYEDKIKIPADGKTIKSMQFEIRDDWGYRLDHLKVATVGINYGKILDPDYDEFSTGIQVPVNDGVIEIEIQAASKPSRGVLSIELMGEVFEQAIRFTTPQLPFVMVGSISGGLSEYRDFTDTGDEPDVEVWRQDSTSIFGQSMLYGGRAALYAKGNLFNTLGLTLSYDSKRNYKDQFYRDLDPEEQYAVYGDASTLEYDAQSRSPLFVKLEHNESSLIYGDFNTAVDQTEFTAYNRTFNGVVADLKGKHQSLKGFVTQSDREMVLDEIRGEGTSGYYYLSESNITEHSDKIVIQTRDKYHSEEIIKSVELVRFQDYSINYEDGSLMFKQPVPSVDAAGNPVTIVVAYEHQSGERESLIGGVRYEGTLFKKLKLGATAVMEERDTSNYLLYGADMNFPIFKWLSLKGEYASSSTPQMSGDPKKGDAYKAELQIKASDFLKINGYYRSVDSAFVNTSQAGRSNETGSTKYGVKALMGNDKIGVLSSEYYMQMNKIGTVNENSAEVFNTTYKRKLGEKTDIMLAYEDARRNQSALQDSVTERRSNIIRAKINYKLFKKVIGFIERDQNLMKGDESKPSFTGIGITYSITEKIGLLMKYKRIEGDTPGNQFVFGIDSKIGKSTDLSGKYEIGGATGNNRNRATIGLKNKWAVTKNLTLNLAYENVSTSDHFETPTIEHQAFSVAYEFLPDIPFKTTGKYEFNIKRESIKNNVMFNIDFKIAHGLAMIAKAVYSKVDYRLQEGDYVIKSDNQLGLAIRPERSDRYNALLKAAFVVDRNTHVDPGVNMQRFILSTHHYWQPNKKLEIGFRYARRIVVDEEIGLFKDQVTTDYLGLRLEYDLTYKWYIAGDLRYLRLMPVGETKLSGSLETGYLLANNLQVGIGYALNSFDDPDFASQNYSFKNFFLTLHMKFSEDIFNWK